jgi:hypothetical protein
MKKSIQKYADHAENQYWAQVFLLWERYFIWSISYALNAKPPSMVLPISSTINKYIAILTTSKRLVQSATFVEKQ